MSYRLKNSDFRLFFGVLDGKVRDSGVYIGEGIGIYFRVFLSGESMSGVGGWSGVKKLFVDRLR